MISIIRKSLTNEEKLKQFNECIEHAKTLTEKKRYYFGKFEHTSEEAITWWKKKATKRYDSLIRDDRIRREQELWSENSDIDIIR